MEFAPERARPDRYNRNVDTNRSKMKNVVVLRLVLSRFPSSASAIHPRRICGESVEPITGNRSRGSMFRPQLNRANLLDYKLSAAKRSLIGHLDCASIKDDFVRLWHFKFQRLAQSRFTSTVIKLDLVCSRLNDKIQFLNFELAQAASGCAPSVEVLPIFDVKQARVCGTPLGWVTEPNFSADSYNNQASGRRILDNADCDCSGYLLDAMSNRAKNPVLLAGPKL
ncbi:hypothetical protein K0M31_019417 [Melipona bicolor]|uniref:Uncharacterized protein n=1 Tax=Melipona bicolor TaxID=60889 RepID=A0AA40KRD0_9HYME|nr:hypothetical protein K0M31_019417 [Melipona bicolor]